MESSLLVFREDVNRRFGEVDKRFDTVDKRLDKLDARIESSANRLGTLLGIYSGIVALALLLSQLFLP